MKIRSLMTIAILCFSLACAKEKVENEPEDKPDYLDQWLGTYQDTSRHWLTYSMEHEEEFKHVNIEVLRGSIDSTLLLVITYNDTTVDIEEDLHISALGSHYSNWGSGSSYSSLRVKFREDEIEYYSYWQCGIDCSGGIEFMAKKTGR